MTVTYTPNVPAWADAPSTQSPVSAARLNHIETGLQTVAAAVGQSGNATSIQGKPVSSTAPAVGQVLIWDGTQWSPAAGGGVAGNATQIQGRPVSAAAPSNGNTLVWSVVAGQWVPAGAGSISVDGTSLHNLLTISVGTTDDLGATPAGPLVMRINRASTVTDNARALVDETSNVTIEDHATLGGMFANPNAAFGRFGLNIYQANTVNSNMTRTAGLFVSAAPWNVANGTTIQDCAAIWLHHDVSTVPGQPESVKMAGTHYGVLGHIGALFGSASTALGFHSEIARFTTTGLSGYDNSAHFHIGFNNATKVLARGILMEPFWSSPAASGGYGMNFAMPDYPSQHIGPLGVNGNFLGGTANDNVGFETSSQLQTFTGSVFVGSNTLSITTSGVTAQVEKIGHPVTGPGIPAGTYIVGAFGQYGLSQNANASTSGTYTVGQTRVMRLRGISGASIAAIPSGNKIAGMLAYQSDGFFKPNAGLYYMNGALNWARILDGESFNYCNPSFSAVFDLGYVTIGTTDNIQTGIGTRLRIVDTIAASSTGDNASFTFEIAKIPALGTTSNIYGLTVGTANDPTKARIVGVSGATISNLTGINTFFCSDGGAGTFGSINGVWAQAGHKAATQAGAIYGVRGTATIPFNAQTGGAQFMVGGNFSVIHAGAASGGGQIGTAVSLYLTAPAIANVGYYSNAETYRYTNSSGGTTNIPVARGYGPYSISTSDGTVHQVAAIPIAVDMSVNGGTTSAGAMGIKIRATGNRTLGGSANDCAYYEAYAVVDPTGAVRAQNQTVAAETNSAWGGPSVGTTAFGAMPIQVTGVAGTTIAWTVFVEVISIAS